jgi:hypothetical protein
VVQAKRSPDSSALIARSLSHKTRALGLLRTQLRGADQCTNILTLVRLLISLDFGNGDFEAARVHLRGIKTMCKHDPDLSVNLRELLLIADVWIAMALLSKPEIDPEQYNPGSLTTQPWYDHLTYEQIGELERPFKAIEVMRLLGPELHRLLIAAEELMHSKVIIGMQGNSSANAKTVLWMSRRGSATTGALMSQYESEMDKARHSFDVEDGLVSYVRAAFCLALILHMNIAWMDLEINYNFSNTYPAIEPILRRCAESVSSNRPAIQKLFAWLCFLCAVGDDIFAARRDLAFSGWAAETFLATCVSMDMADAKLAKAMLLSVAYEEDFMDDFLKECLSDPSLRPTEPFLPFPRWRKVLNHFVPHK